MCRYLVYAKMKSEADKEKSVGVQWAGQVWPSPSSNGCGEDKADAPHVMSVEAWIAGELCSLCLSATIMNNPRLCKSMQEHARALPCFRNSSLNLAIPGGGHEACDRINSFIVVMQVITHSRAWSGVHGKDSDLDEPWPCVFDQDRDTRVQGQFKHRQNQSRLYASHCYWR